MKEHNITISRKKLELSRSINFAGHTISDGSIRPDDKKFRALKDLKQSANVKELHSFLGLVG